MGVLLSGDGFADCPACPSAPKWGVDEYRHILVSELCEYDSGAVLEPKKVVVIVGSFDENCGFRLSNAILLLDVFRDILDDELGAVSYTDDA